MSDGMQGAGPRDEPAGDELTVHVAGGAGLPDQLLRISRPVDGMVRVTERSGDDWSLVHEHEMPADALLRALEEAARQRRRLGEELYRIRVWLTGAGG